MRPSGCKDIFFVRGGAHSRGDDDKKLDFDHFWLLNRFSGFKIRDSTVKFREKNLTLNKGGFTNMSQEYGSFSYAATAAEADADDRALFIRRTYLHLAGAVAAFAGMEYALLHSELGRSFANTVLSNGRGGWLLVLGGLMLVSWMTRGMAASGSRVMQYLGLGLYVFAQALIFVPLIAVALYYSQAPGGSVLLPNAVLLTAILFLALTLVSLTQRRDFNFLGAFLTVGGMIALGLIVCGYLFGFNLGLAFSGGMIVLASAAILYDTSNIMHRYPTDAHVAASLELFASVILLFWYILRLLMALNRR